MPKSTPAKSPRRPKASAGNIRIGKPRPLHLLITAGPTHEPIDEVRFIGNRSSGRLGVALADAAAERGWRVTLLLGPTSLTPSDPQVRVERFRTVEDLRGLLARHWRKADALVMAAAVADYRPAVHQPGTKLRRSSAGLTLHLEPTPDLLAEITGSRKPGQVVVGFALEPRTRLFSSAREKLTRKRVDLIVANPLETMDAPKIEATVLGPDGVVMSTDGAVTKARFAAMLLRTLRARLR